MASVRDGYIRKSGRTTERMRSSVNGNPRWQVTFDDGSHWPTAPDSSCAYGINNSELDGEVQILLNSRSNIVDIRPLD
jgi:hypothetical protein